MQLTTKSWHQKHNEQTVELQCVHLLLALLNSKTVPNPNQSDHVQFYKLHFLSKVWRWKALWKSINIQQTIFLGPNECQLILIKTQSQRTGLKVKLEVREVHGELSTL